jgi:HPt (histidine-containing phosphotransfer) domain-containing protein
MPEGQAHEAIDWSHLMDQFGGDRSVVSEIVEAYAAETRENIAQLPAKLDAGDATEVRRHAHTLGGTMRMFRVEQAETLARDLETLAHSGSLEGADDLVTALLDAAQAVLPELDRFVATGGDSAGHGGR